MKKEKSKINFQRYGALFLAVLIACSSVVCMASPVSAVEVDIPAVYSDTVSFMFEPNFDVFGEVFNSSPTHVDYPMYVAFSDNVLRVGRRIYFIYVTSTNIYYIFRDTLDSLGDNDWAVAASYDSDSSSFEFVGGYEFLYVELPISLLSESAPLFKSLLALRGRYCFNEPLLFSSYLDFSFRADFVSKGHQFYGMYFSTVNSGTRLLGYYFSDLLGQYSVYLPASGFKFDEFRFIDFGSDFVDLRGSGLSYEGSIFLLSNMTDAPIVDESLFFIDRLTTGFTAVIGWFGELLTSLLTTNGSLILAFVLISVGFGLGLLGKGFRWLRGLLFGY